jgi:hypothetical protein
VTCSSTCRQRLHRGRDLAYLNRGLTAKEQRQQRQWHDAVAKDIQEQRKKMADVMKRRELNRQRRRERRAIEALIESLGRAELAKLRASGDYDAVVSEAIQGSPPGPGSRFLR